MNFAPHIPVMLPEVLVHMAPRDGGVYVDGTFGAGGYSEAILEAADCVVIAIDRDVSALGRAQEFQAKYKDRFHFLQGCFGDVQILLAKAGFDVVDGFVLDLGVSSMQIDRPERGFSFRFDGPLDMRMTQSTGESAKDFIHRVGEEELANTIYKYGEERLSRKIAKAIVMKRKEGEIETTAQLADIVRGVVRQSPKEKSDPATRTFQALRIAVNDELGELERALAAVPSILSERGRLVVVTFHSLEDRIVKNFCREKSGRVARVSKYMPDQADAGDAPQFKDLTPKAVPPSSEEIAVNPRSRSAKLRAIEYIGGRA